MRYLLPLALLAAVAAGAAPSIRAAGGECGLPSAPVVWMDYGEASVRADTRAILAKPGVVVATSGTAVPQQFRNAGAATTYFELNLDRIVGQPSAPTDAASVIPATDALYDRATKATGCTTPWITLNELAGSSLPAPWSATNTVYRANVLTVVQRLAARGAHPALLIHGDPTVVGDTAAWWRSVAQSGQRVYEAYYDAHNMYPLGPLLASRRMRLGMRVTLKLFTSVGIPTERVGFMLGFHSAQTPGTGGRQGLEPTEAWLRVVKWEGLAAKQIATDYGLPYMWSWGWGTFGPESVDADKPAAACTWLWSRDPSLCDAPTMGGPAFDTSRVEGQIVLPTGVLCSFAGGRVSAAEVNRLQRITKDRHAALTAQFVRAVLSRAAPVDQRAVLAVERRVVATRFHGKRPAYLRALAARHADVTIARGILADSLRRARLAKTVKGQTVFDAVAARLAVAGDNAICVKDELPGAGEPLQVGNARDIGAIDLGKYLPFVLGDRTAPAAPLAPTAVRAGTTVTLTWTTGREPDLAGYDIVRSNPDGTTTKLNFVGLVGRAKWTDLGAPAGVSYRIQAVDTSGNVSAPSPPVAG